MFKKNNNNNKSGLTKYICCKAYIPPERKIPGPRLLRWGYQHVGILNVKICVSRRQTPDASKWNIGGVGSWRWVFALGMYISCVR